MLKSKLQKMVIVTGGTLAGVAGAALPAFAAGTADTAVITAIGDIADTSIATLSGIAPVAITIFGAIFVWKIGKKVFGIITN
ncbi:MAG: hypothetical protein LBT22_08440 [Peptococcaceae bacterium]|jgi:hypothetical protein|nr:hypothetical protein [Peptococcaceae bacterium]